MGRKSGDSSDEEAAALWEAVTRSIRPFHAKKKRPAPKADAEKVRPAARSAPPRPISTPSRTAPPAAGFDRATAEKLRKGKLEIEARLDLHGFSQEQAYGALHHFLRRAEANGARTVLIITGKGKVGGGVLRRMVPLWLAEMTESVLAVTAAKPKDGGEGALYVRLRNKKKK